MSLSDEELLRMHEAGHVCGDDMDMFEGRPTGSIRISFGYMSQRRDVDTLVELIKDNFVEARTGDEEGVAGQDDDVRVVGLFVYPVKSCGGMSVKQWRMTQHGLEYDRGWMIMQGTKVLTQKNEPLLSQIRASVNLDSKKLILTFRDEDNNSIEVPINERDLSSCDVINELCVGNVCGERVEASDCGAEVSNWLEEVLGIPDLKLVRAIQRRSRRRKDYSQSLSNDSSVLLLSVASIDQLRSLITRNCLTLGESSDQFTVESLTQRFRGNVVVDADHAFIEESWRDVVINKLEMTVTGACRRCKMISVEQESGEMTREPLRTLAAMKNRNFNFGVHIEPVLSDINDQEKHILKLGDYVKIFNSHLQ